MEEQLIIMRISPNLGKVHSSARGIVATVHRLPLKAGWVAKPVIGPRSLSGMFAARGSTARNAVRNLAEKLGWGAPCNDIT